MRTLRFAILPLVLSSAHCPRLPRCSQRLLEEFNATGQVPPGHTDAQLWDAKRLVDSAIHPQTGERILMPFRMSGFVPFGVPTVLGMLLPSTAASTALTVFWQTGREHNKQSTLS